MTRPATDIARPPGAVDPDQNLLSLLACPKCLGPILYRPAEEALDCQSCLLRFPIEDGIPVLLSEGGHPLDA